MATTDIALRNKLAMTQASRKSGTGSEHPILVWIQAEDTARQLAMSLPMGMKPERYLKIILTEIRKTPDLLKCQPASFKEAVMTAAQLGLEPGPLGHAYLLPFWNKKKGVHEVNLILGYKGLIDLARRSGHIVNIVAREVCENDEFEFEYGLHEKLVHKPKLSDRGEPIAYYGVAHYKDGGHLILVMSIDDIERYRQRSRARDSGPWQSDPTEMRQKTVIRRMAKFLPLTIEAAEAVATDEAREFGYEQPVIDIGPLSIETVSDSQEDGEVSPENAAPESRAAVEDVRQKAGDDGRDGAQNGGAAEQGSLV